MVFVDHIINSMIPIASGMCTAFALQVLVNLLTHAKYVCANFDTNDVYLVALRAVEWVHVILACMLTVLCFYWTKSVESQSYVRSPVKVPSQIVWTLSLAACIAQLYMEYAVCDSNCLVDSTISAALNAGENLSDPAVVKFISQTARMTGVESTGGFVDNYLTPSWFKIPSNYCRETLQALPGPNSYVNSFAERCLAYGCTSSFVPGRQTQKYFAYVGLLLQTITAYVLWLDDVSDKNQPKKNDDKPLPSSISTESAKQSNLKTKTKNPYIAF